VIIADLGQQPCPKRNTEPGHTIDDLPVRVGSECGLDLGLEFGECVTHRIELPDEAAKLGSHC
jgi:hypothetical protein